MTIMKDHADVINLWPSCGVFGRAIGIDAALGRQWRHRRRIPAEYWPAIAKTKMAQANEITVDRLAKLMPARKKRNGK